MDSAELLLCLGGRMFQWFLSTVVFHLFDLLRRLPEKEVRADSCAKHGDQSGQIISC